MRKLSNYNNRITYCVARKDNQATHHALRLFSLTLILLALFACSNNADGTPAPPPIHYGEDVCEFCGMIISEEGFAAAYITSDGHGHTFDDIGDMVKAHREMQEEAMAFFVHDYESREWIRAEIAHFVLSDSLTTPMLSGLAAFASIEQADAFATEVGGKMLTFEELLAQP